ncbi:hypothetical protein D3C87_2179200 [compost metagenome]
MRPFPAGPAFGIDDAAIVKTQQEFTGFIGDVDQVFHQAINQLLQFLAADKAFRLAQ